MVVFVNPLNSFAPVRRLINLFRCVPDISSASLFIHFELTEKAQEEVLQLIVQNKAGSSEDGKEFCILAQAKKEIEFETEFHANI
uniref:Uncharacterized protein n=1 Tax=Ditylenchus dipsaci TaxID=166011 RepID=A0A915CQ16_9BILA